MYGSDDLWFLNDPEPIMATHDDSIREYAYNAGMDRPNLAWINTPQDVWMPNPHYHGPKVPHPEDYDDDEEY